MAEDHASMGVKECNAETLTDILRDYVASVKELSHTITNPTDGTSGHDAKEDEIGQIISHLLELGDDMKDCIPNETQIPESWRNLGQTMESGMKLVQKLLEKSKPDPIQELGFSVSVRVTFSRKDKKALSRHKDEMDGRVNDMLSTSRVPCTEFFQQHRAALEDRISLLGPILGKLEQVKVLNDGEREDIESRRTDSEKNHTLLRMLRKKGTQAQQAFYKVLKEVDPYLVENLENPVKLNEDLEMGT